MTLGRRHRDANERLGSAMPPPSRLRVAVSAVDVAYPLEFFFVKMLDLKNDFFFTFWEILGENTVHTI